MRMTFYYLWHSFKNQIKKLCRTWVVVFILACMLLGGLIGVLVGSITSDLPGEPDDPADEVTEEVEMTAEEKICLAETLTVSISFLSLLLSVVTADKSGGKLFLPADVSLLFPSPLRPQSVLFFRLMAQTAAFVAGGIYLLAQVPTLSRAFGVGAALSMVFAFLLLLCYSKALSVLFYTLCGTHERVRRALRPTAFALVGLLALCFLFYRTARPEESTLRAALSFLDEPAVYFLPIAGWLKGAVGAAAGGEVLRALFFFGILVLCFPLLLFSAYRVKADFYEDAMLHAEELAERTAAAAEQTAVRRKKERNDKMKRDGLHHGQGASIFFFKTLYNRFRFAHLRIFTKTSETYLAVSLILSVLFLRSEDPSPAFFVVSLVLSAMAFYRALGSPVREDLGAESLFFLVPDASLAKIFYSFSGGMLCVAMDAAPALLLCALLVRPALWAFPLALLMLLSVSALSDSVGLLIHLLLPTGISQNLKGMVSIFFLYFGLVPDALLLFFGYTFGKMPVFLLLTLLLNLGLTAVTLCLSPILIDRGRK